MEWNCLDSLVRTSFPSGPYGEIMVRDIYKNAKGTYYVVRTAGRGSNFCLNLNADHKSNTIYFYVTVKGISQKCWCRCQTTEGRRHGLCKEWQSAATPLTLRHKQCLFPGSSSTTMPSTATSLAAMVGPVTHDSKLAHIESLRQMCRVRYNQLDRDDKRTARNAADEAPARKRMKL
jgi:hypothetical protein